MRIVVDVRGGDHGPVLRSIQERHDPNTRGGAPLLGLSRPDILSTHGNTRVVAIARALAQAATAVSQNLTQQIATAAEALNS